LDLKLNFTVMTVYLLDESKQNGKGGAPQTPTSLTDLTYHHLQRRAPDTTHRKKR